MEQECIYNHNPNDIENSLKMLKKRHMNNPSVYYFVCQECNKILAFTRNKEGAFIKIE